MIVIATYNGLDVLKGLILDIKSFNIPNEEVCIVDNKSTDWEFIKYLMDLKYNGYCLLLNTKPTYQLGAYKLALETLKSDVWFFLQDSIRIKQNIFKEITPELTDKNVYTFLTFNDQRILFNPGVSEFLIEHFQMNSYRIGIFGNMFFAKDSVAQLIKNDWIITKNKLYNNCMEIGLGVIFDRHNIEIIGLDIYDERINVFDGSTLYPFFDKIAKRRE